jgi:hypothetical protein
MEVLTGERFVENPAGEGITLFIQYLDNKIGRASCRERVS